uniref:Uncharacterized protein n=1 Tax=Triticum urartu TaxID=4572 RepID=A0A8R7UDK5_TRIUA
MGMLGINQTYPISSVFSLAFRFLSTVSTSPSSISALEVVFRLAAPATFSTPSPVPKFPTFLLNNLNWASEPAPPASAPSPSESPSTLVRRRSPPLDLAPARVTLAFCLPLVLATTGDHVTRGLLNPTISASACSTNTNLTFLAALELPLLASAPGCFKHPFLTITSATCSSAPAQSCKTTQGSVPPCRFIPS